MECKKLLSESNGDIEKAIEIARKKGVKTSITERVASEGRVVATMHDHVAAAVEVVCNTDFTAKSDAVGKLLEVALHKQVSNPDQDIRNDAEVKNAVTAIAQQTGENVQISKAIALSNPQGHVGAYVYSITNKIAVLMSFTGAKPDAELLKDLGGHIAFARPAGLSRNDIPADLIAKEREIAVEQAKATGKPQEIAEKIAEGKMGAFYKERALLDQDFFNTQKFKGSIQQMLKGKGTSLVKYVRVEVGQS